MHRSLWMITILTAMALGSSEHRLLLADEPLRPNILVILSDDQGYVDAGFQGGGEARTPNLDRLANSGVRCLQGYASHPFCSPTRAGLLTGKYQARFGHEYNPVYDPLDAQEGLPLGEKLLPEHLVEAGYRTGWIGKWHLGASPAHSPWARGFQEGFGFIGGGHQFRNWKPNENQYTLPLLRDGQPTTEIPAHLTTAFGAEAAKFVRRHQAAPWFLYLAFNAPHTPHQPTPEREAEFAHIENPQRRRCLAQISLLDDAVGEVLKALEESGQRQRTLIFFLGDNGGAVRSGADNGSLHGQKGELYEGGVRVPFVISWPEKLRAQGTYEAPVCSLDILGTTLAAAGLPAPASKAEDSVNLLPYLQGEQNGPPHSQLFWRANKGNDRAIRQGNWKLIRQADRPDELYNLEADPGERENLAEQKEALLAEMRETLAAWERELSEPAFLGSSVKNEDWGPGGANEQKRKQRKPENQSQRGKQTALLTKELSP